MYGYGRLLWEDPRVVFDRQVDRSQNNTWDARGKCSFLRGWDEQIGVLEEKIERRVLESPAAQLLLTIPGVGQTTAAVIVAELGEIERFREPLSNVGLRHGIGDRG